MEVITANKTIRVDARTHETLRRIASEEQRSMGSVSAEAVAHYEKERFWRQLEEDMARLRADPVAWQEYQDEIAIWDATLMDGLEDEEPYDTHDNA